MFVDDQKCGTLWDQEGKQNTGLYIQTGYRVSGMYESVAYHENQCMRLNKEINRWG